MIPTKLASTTNTAIANREKTYIEENVFWILFCTSRANFLVKSIRNKTQDYCVQAGDKHWKKKTLLARLSFPGESSLLPNRD